MTAAHPPDHRQQPEQSDRLGPERDELAGLAEIALRHRLHLISDEIYEKIVYPPAAHLSIASLGPEIENARSS